MSEVITLGLKDIERGVVYATIGREQAKAIWRQLGRFLGEDLDEKERIILLAALAYAASAEGLKAPEVKLLHGIINKFSEVIL